jgi:DNA polymerase-4
MDAFYASVEQLDRPELRGKPVIVGGVGGRGVVSTASYEARRFGVHSAMPTHEARRLCPHGIFVPGRMERYVEVGRQIRAVFHEFTPEVEPLSLDEAFLDITRSLQLFGSARDIAIRLKGRVREATGLTVSVGIGPTKMVAKIASDLGKPDGLVEVVAGEVADFLRPLPVRRLWGAGPKTCAALERLGIRTFGELAAHPAVDLARRLGDHAAALQALARGDDARVVEPDRERKSYGEEQTFDRDLRDGEALRSLIAAQAEAVARRLRADGCAARTVTLKYKLAQRIGPGKYPQHTRRMTLAEPVDDGAAIARAALELWNEAGAGLTIRLVGVAVSGIEARNAGQLSLFQAPENRRRADLNRALDALTERFGKDVVRRADTVGARTSRARSLGKGPRTD